MICLGYNKSQFVFFGNLSTKCEEVYNNIYYRSKGDKGKLVIS